MGINMDEITKKVSEAVKEASDILRGEFEKSLSIMNAELEALRAENSELKMRLINTESC